MTLPDVVLVIPNQGNFTCEQSALGGLNGGLLDSTTCGFAPIVVGTECGCDAVGEFFSPGDFIACNVCGDNGERVTMPQATISLESVLNEFETCAEVQQKGDLGFFSPTECESLVDVSFEPCGCALPPNPAPAPPIDHSAIKTTIDDIILGDDDRKRLIKESIFDPLFRSARGNRRSLRGV